MLWVSHHVRETVVFPRVLVFEGGRIVEDGPPQALLRKSSRYASMVNSEAALEQRLRCAPWRAIAIEGAGSSIAETVPLS